MSTSRLLCLLFQLMNSKVGTMQTKTKHQTSATKRDLTHGKIWNKIWNIYFPVFPYTWRTFYIQGHSSSTSHKDMDFRREYDLKMTIKFSILGGKSILKVTALYENKVLALFELGTFGFVARSYTHCAKEMDTWIWRYKLFHIMP